MEQYNVLVAYRAVPAHARHYETVETGTANPTGEELRKRVVGGSAAAGHARAFRQIESGMKQIGGLC
jgi:hypothetical protein